MNIFNSYEVGKTGFFEMFNIESLFDYHPLSAYYVSSEVLVSLHYHLCLVKKLRHTVYGNKKVICQTFQFFKDLWQTELPDIRPLTFLDAPL